MEIYLKMDGNSPKDRETFRIRAKSIIPEFSLVMAERYDQCKDFQSIIEKRLVYVDNAEHLKGRNNFTIVQLGRYKLHKDWLYLDDILVTIRGVTKVTIFNWR